MLLQVLEFLWENMNKHDTELIFYNLPFNVSLCQYFISFIWSVL